MQRLTVQVFGLVQGVSFRYYTRLRANALGLTGWVRNERDGSVRTVAEGPAPVLAEFHEFLQRGSPAARVDRLEIDWSAATGEFERFEVRW